MMQYEVICFENCDWVCYMLWYLNIYIT
jgi:hypothetical protein